MGAESTGKMRETFHLILIISSLGIILLAAVAMPHATRVAEGGSFVHLVPHQRRQQLLNAVEMMYGRDHGLQEINPAIRRWRLLKKTVDKMYGYPSANTQRRQVLLSTTSEIDRALGESEDGYRENRERIGRVQATGMPDKNGWGEGAALTCGDRYARLR